MGIDVNEVWKIGQVARVFFDQKTGWFRWRENEGFIKDRKGNPIGSRSPNAKKGGKGDRIYTKEDIKEIALSLHREGIIDDEGLHIALQRLHWCTQPIHVLRINAVQEPEEEETK